VSILVHIFCSNQFLKQNPCRNISYPCIFTDTPIACHLVTHQASKSAVTFLTYSLGNARSSYSTRLSYKNVTISLVFSVVVKYVLRNLCCFATSSRPYRKIRLRMNLKYFLILLIFPHSLPQLQNGCRPALTNTA
jgi:hypothetical protein